MMGGCVDMASDIQHSRGLVLNANDVHDECEAIKGAYVLRRSSWAYLFANVKTLDIDRVFSM